MSEPRNWKRIRERLQLSLPVRVRFKESLELEWSEVTRLIDVSPFGASFTLKRPIETGRLVYMTIPMPRQLRVFDHVEDQYKVWALVRHIRPSGSADDKSTLFELGVAFIGKQPPRSYIQNPAQRYDVGKITLDNLSPVAEWTPPNESSSDKRQATRHGIPVDMLIETLNEDGTVDSREDTVTENISRQGAALYTTLTLPVGRIIRLTSEQYRLSVFAAVRGSSMGATGVPRIHVEFIGREWPL